METDQIVQIAGALLILSAFVLSQVGRISPSTLSYQMLNLAGSATLALLAWVERQWGFLLLEAAWAIVSLWALLRLVRRRVTPATP
jgi:hypothetical protein